MGETCIPFGSEFSPSQVDLPELLSICKENEGNRDALEEAIRERYFSQHGGGDGRNQRKLAMNCRLGLKAYRIIDDACFLTVLGSELHSISGNLEKLYERLARHILLNLNGMCFIQCLRDLTIAGENITLTTLRAALRERGITYPSGGKHPSMMRLWLKKAGVIVGNRWQVDNDRIAEILEADDNFDALRRLTQNQRAFLMALVNSGVIEPQPASQIKKLAEATYGVCFPEKSLPKDVLNALVDLGYITITKTTAGRGAKPFDVAPTESLLADVTLPLLKQLRKHVDPKLVDLQRKPLGDILEELRSENRYISGLALEALAFKLMRLLGMDYVATRLRAQSTGGAEVDLIFESTRLVFSRWQIQCKNSTRVVLDDIAKEVGLTHFLKSNVIVIVSTGQIGAEARRYARKIMLDSHLAVVLIDEIDIQRIVRNPSRIVDVFHREAKTAMKLKKLDL
ncbi:MAG: restriction endonuclease [Planctomycetia bacterium]|nr:restriction endonuclease [Planctomycetia bacterium]